MTSPAIGSQSLAVNLVFKKQVDESIYMEGYVEFKGIKMLNTLFMVSDAPAFPGIRYQKSSLIS